MHASTPSRLEPKGLGAPANRLDNHSGASQFQRSCDFSVDGVLGSSNPYDVTWSDDERKKW